MSEAFVPLALFLRAEPPPAVAAETPPELATGTGAIAPADDDRSEIEETVRAARRFRAALADAVDARVPALLREIAGGVLARELELRDADVATIVAAALARVERDSILSIHANPERAGVLAGFSIPLVGDERLARDDVRIELRSGTIDLRLLTRLERVLEACLP